MVKKFIKLTGIMLLAFIMWPIILVAILLYGVYKFVQEAGKE